MSYSTNHIDAIRNVTSILIQVIGHVHHVGGNGPHLSPVLPDDVPKALLPGYNSLKLVQLVNTTKIVLSTFLETKFKHTVVLMNIHLIEQIL